MTIYTHDFIKCPHCNGETGRRIDHLYDEPLPTSFGPWTCDACGKRFRGTVNAPRKITVDAIDGGRELSPQMVLLKYEANDRTTYFVMDHKRYNPGGVRESDEENQSSVRYFFEEHSCPTNWLAECVAVIERGDTDPHGFLQFVRAVDVPDDFNIHDDGEWERLFPEAFTPSV